METPSWAVFGNDEKGFDPVETRHYRNKLKYRQPVEEQVEETVDSSIEKHSEEIINR